MLAAKSESLASEFDKVRKMVTDVADEKHLAGLDNNGGGEGGRMSEQQMLEEEVKAEIA